MKMTDRYLNKMKWDELIFWVLLVASFLCIVFFGFKSLNNNVRDREIFFINGWENEEGKEVDLGCLLDLKKNKNGKIVIEKAVPNGIDNDDSLNFRAKNLIANIYLDNELVYTLDYGENPTGRGYGSAFVYIGLKLSDIGKTIRMEIEPIYQDDSSMLDRMVIQKKEAYVNSYIESHFLLFFISVIIIVFGIAVLVVNRVSNKKNKEGLDFLVVFALIVGTWSAIDTLIPTIITGDVVSIKIMDYSLLFLMCYPIIKFLNHLTVLRKKIYPRFVSVMSILVAAICTFLRVLNIMDIHNSIFLVHIEMFVSIIIIWKMFYDEIRNTKKTGITNDNFEVFPSIVIFSICVLIDVSKYYILNKKGNNTSFFIRIGTMIVVITIMRMIFYKIVKYLKLAGATEDMEKIAYKDTLTSLGNRAACNEFENQIENNLKNSACTDAMVCQFDLNNLKLVNDNYGHDFGDRYIQSAAEAISASFGKDGKCFRIGGDEFIAYIVGEDLESRYEKCLKEFLEFIENYNANSLKYKRRKGDLIDYPLSIAHGVALVSQTVDKTLTTAKKIADKRMYKNKIKMKENNKKLQGDF
ncbi:diguanylate cyclase (GGDEF) domain-containing protein [Acetitomaculum ruminis DSM 5522]|uniref:Diguanylate cyclase (GGDEF) domain-containing protein n=1 Tax=Acetitomaculum ruminis DSM 5522 TaxID=1120918 RepID=A0A1I0ZUX7_9FIRM|nr:GGDEF domain-containing protein [Acetitomaculum ruminis]SFB29559.1 diguanylate cyclase (GGDEF) domain-containing protein [Acetitomaculum ruminis DSM 5522]